MIHMDITVFSPHSPCFGGSGNDTGVTFKTEI